MANFQDALDRAFPADKPASSPSGSANNSVSAFVREVGPIAERVGADIGVDPSILIGQWGLETRWGKSVIPGTNNYGNIKDFRGSGVVARDNMNGSVDKYRAFKTGEEFADHFVDLLTRKYGNALNSGDNALAYGAALRRNGYAEDPNYATKIASAADMVRKAGGKGQASIYAPRGEFIGQTEKVIRDAKKQQEIADEGMGTAFAKGFGDATDQIPELAVGAGTALADVFGLDELREAGLGYLQKNKEQAQDEARSYASFTDSLENGDMGRWAAYALGYGVNQLAQAAITGGIGATVGKVGLVGLLKGTAERVTAEALAKGAAQEVAAKAGMEAAELAAKKYGAAFAMYGNTYGQELGSIYPDAVEQSQKTGNPVDLAKVFGSAGVAAALEAAPEIGIAGKLIDGAGKGSKRMLGRAAGTIPKQIGLEGGTEYAQTGVEQWGAQRPLDTPEARKERIDSAAMGAIMGGPAGAIEAVPAPRAEAVPDAGVTQAAPPTPKPNSPLSNAAAAGQAAQPAQPQQPVDPTAQRLAAVQSFIDDKAFIQAVRGAQGYGPESVTELLSAFAKARNPNLDPLIRERALTDLEGFVQGFNNRPNFTFGQNTTEAQQPSNQVAPYQPQGGAVASPVQRDDGRTLDGEIITRPERMAGANPSRLNAPPVLGLPTEEALQAKRDADAAYDQAYQDLVKAEALGEADAELQAKQQAIRDARTAREQADARLKEIEQAIEGNRAKQTAEKRRAILDAILADPETANPAARLSAELSRQGFRDTSPTADELATIQRFEDIKAAQAEPDVIPSAPNEMEAYAPPRAQQNVTVPSQQSEAKPKQAPARKLTPLEIRNYIKAGAVLNGDVLTLPDGTTIKLRGPQIAAAREAVRNAQVESAPAEAVDEPQAEPQQVELQAPESRSAEDAIRDAFSSLSSVSLGVSYPISVSANGRVVKFMARQDKPSNGRSRPVIHLQHIKRGRMIAGFPEAWIEQWYKLDGNNRLSEDGMPREVSAQEAEQFNARFGEKEPIDVSTRTDDQLRYLAENGKPGWREAAQAELTKRESAKPEIRSDIDAAAHEAATSPLNDTPQPTDAQKEAGNYKVGRVRVQGMDISIENPQGSVRSGTSPDGKKWQSTLANHYGYFTGTKAADGDHLDVFLTDGAEDAPVIWIIDQKNKDGSFDEHKTVLGPRTEEEARAAYLSNYEPGWDGLGAISSMPIEAFKAWAFDGKKKRKPLVYVEPEATTETEPATTEKTTEKASDPREAYADEKERAYITKRGGKAPPKAVEAVRVGAYREYDRKPQSVNTPKPKYAAGDRVIPSLDVMEGDIVTTPDGKKWMAKVKRGNSIPVVPFEGGKPIVSADTARRFGLDETVVTHTGTNFYGHGNQPKPVEAQQPTHQDPGQPAEAATPAVIAKSIQKAADNTPLNLKDARASLLADIDRAIAEVPAENAGLYAELRREKEKAFDERAAKKSVMSSKAISAARDSFNALRDSNVAKTAKQIGFVTFYVPGDGKFKVVNAVEKLQDFRKKVEASPGFKEPAKKPPVPSRDVVQGSYTPRDAILEGDYLNAYELAKAQGKPLVFSVSSNNEPSVYTDSATADGVIDGLAFIVARQAVKDGKWYVIDPSTGLLVNKNGMPTKAAALTAATAKVKGHEDKLRALIADPAKAMPQSRLEAEWLKLAKEKEGVEEGQDTAPENLTSENPEPSPLDLTPKQFHEARMRWVAQEYGLSDAEVRQDYDTDAAKKSDDDLWVSAVRQAFKDGTELDRATLDKLEEVRPGAFGSFLHDYPDANVPSGYQTPSARHAEKEEAEAKRAARSEVAQPSSLSDIFTGLSSRGLAKTRAQKAAEAHPRAQQIAYVQDNFIDILSELEDAGLVKINCD